MTPAALRAKAAALRLTAFETAVRAGKGHIPPALSWADIAAVLFYDVLRLDPMRPDWPGRDRFILSKGHGCLTLYAALADLGFFPRAELDNFEHAMLAGHPDHMIPGVEVGSGSLGHGLGVGAGMALAARLSGASWRTFVVLGDGECQEGSVWEAARFAGEQRLRSLVAIVDANGLGATGRIVGDNLVTKFAAFGWNAFGRDGHDIEALMAPYSVRGIEDGRPVAVIARTTKGRGVSFMEDSPLWHHRVPKGDEIATARAELTAALA